MENIDDAAVFMFQQSADSFKELVYLGRKLSSPEPFAAYLLGHPTAHQALIEHSGDLESFWKECRRDIEAAKRKPESHHRCAIMRLPEDVPAGVLKLLDILRPLVTEIAGGDLSTWEQWSNRGPDASLVSPDMKAHIESLRLLGLWEIPLMEIHHLGEFKEDPVLNSRVADLFDHKENTFMVNTSGSGKTRLLYEGLCQNWGFYFTSILDSNGLGSCDVQECIEPDLRRSWGYRKALPHPDSLAYRPILENNLKVARRRFSEVLLARLIIFRLFIDTVRVLNERLSEDHKRRWLMLQLSTVVKGNEIPNVLARYFQQESDSYVDETIAHTLDEIRTTWDVLSDTPLHLFLVLDEGNYSSREHAKAFRDEYGNYPVLKSILSTWRERMTGIPISFVVAGTEIPKRYFLNDEWKTSRWVSNTGAFDSQDLQKRYILRYLPKSLSESPSGIELLSQAWDWCRGRHRFTVTILIYLLDGGFENPHKLLRRLVYVFTGHVIKDENKFVENEMDVVGPSYGSLDGIFKSLTDNDLIRGTVHEILFNYLITSEHPPVFDDDRIEAVSYGIGRFVDASMKKIAIDEPLLLTTAARWFNKADRSITNYEDFVKMVQCPSMRPYDPAAFISMYLAIVLDGERSLDEIFQFPGDETPSWATKPAQLVRVYTGSDGQVYHAPVGTLDTLCGPALGFNARTSQDLHSWLTFNSGSPFCLCSSSCSADLIFVLKLSNHKLIWVVLRTSGKGTSDALTPEKLQESLDSILPRNLFPAQDESSENTSNPDALRSALTNLPNRFKTLGDHSVLRVDASFPQTTDFAGFKQGAKDKELCAALETSLLEEISAKIPSHKVVDGIIAGFLGRRPQYPNDPPPTRTLKRRRSVDPDSPVRRSIRLPKKSASVPL